MYSAASDLARDGHHLFTLLASRRALQAGSLLAVRLSDPGAAAFYTEQAALIRDRLLDFRGSDGIWRASIPADRNLIHAVDDTAQEIIPSPGERHALQRTGLDCAIPLASVHFGAPHSDTDDGFYLSQPDILATLREYILSFSGLYRINDGRNWTEGWAVGRYAEDVYNGVHTSKGNPWYVYFTSMP